MIGDRELARMPVSRRALLQTLPGTHRLRLLRRTAWRPARHLVVSETRDEMFHMRLYLIPESPVLTAPCTCHVHSSRLATEPATCTGLRRTISIHNAFFLSVALSEQRDSASAPSARRRAAAWRRSQPPSRQPPAARSPRSAAGPTLPFRCWAPPPPPPPTWTAAPAPADGSACCGRPAPPAPPPACAAATSRTEHYSCACGALPRLQHRGH